MSDSLDTEPIFFGCRGGAGHYLWPLSGGRDLAHPAEAGLPWERIDGKLTPTANKSQSAAAVRHRDGWTALAWHDYRIDKRPGSNSAVFIPTAMLTFEVAVTLARELFPQDVPADIFDAEPAATSERAS